MWILGGDKFGPNKLRFCGRKYGRNYRALYGNAYKYESYSRKGGFFLRLEDQKLPYAINNEIDFNGENFAPFPWA